MAGGPLFKEGGGDLPEGVQVHTGKMLWNVKECIPATLTAGILYELRCASGHPGRTKLWSMANVRYH